MKTAFGLSLVMLAANALAAGNLTSGERSAAKIVFPATVTYEKLSRCSFPRVFTTAEEMKARRAELATSPILQKYLKKCQAAAAPVLKMSDERLRELIPPPGQPVVYGLGMSLDPDGVPLRWAGYENPHCVLGKNNKVYPNADFPDDGGGWSGQNNQKCFFRSRAAGFAFDWIEKQLEALGDCYFLTGDEIYAHKAAVLFDGLAWSYQADLRGPLDYPISRGDEQRGGRLNRPYYQVARALVIYVRSFENMMPSGAFGAPSHYLKGATVFDNVARNLFFNGGIYCLGFTLDGRQLHNGHADYLRGNASTGLLLGIPELVEPLWDEALGLKPMLNVNVDRDGFYVESSHLYSLHSLTLYMSLADMYESGVRQGFPGAFSMVDDPALFLLLFRCFDKAEVGGRMPLTGDAGPDRGRTHPGNLRAPDAAHKRLDTAMNQQLVNAWWLLARSKNEKTKAKCREFLRNAYSGDLDVPDDNSILCKLPPGEFAKIQSLQRDPDYFQSGSILYGGKGLAILRGGKAEAPHGCQLLFGALHNHSQLESLSWIFMNKGTEWSYDPGYYNTHYRFGWTTESVSHQQMTINAQSVLPSGSGEILAWQPSGTVQYVMAAHLESVAPFGATRFERLMAQADGPDGELDYWFDLGIADGGTFRDDSFHTVMSRAESAMPFQPLEAFSLYGERYKGQYFLDDFRLSGETDKAFYWHPEGAGYGFLTRPAYCKSGESLRLRMTRAIYPEQAKLQQAITVDMPGEAEREYFLCHSMKVKNSDSVPYLIRRDRTPLSLFAKVLHFADETAGISRVKSVRTLNVTPQAADVRAYHITLQDGRNDVWFVGDRKNEYTFSAAGRTWKSRAGVEVFRMDAAGQLLEHHASGKPLAGVVRDIRFRGDEMVFSVDWEKGTKLPEQIGNSLAAVSHGTGDSANWSVRGIDGDKLVIAGSKVDIGRVVFQPLAGRAGEYTIRPDSSFLVGRGSEDDLAEIKGRSIVDDAGVIRAKGEAFGGQSGGMKVLKLQAKPPLKNGCYRIAEVSAGDRITLLVNE